MVERSLENEGTQPEAEHQCIPLSTSANDVNPGLHVTVHPTKKF